MIDNGSYYTVCGWMRTDLQLKGNDLLLYAVLYSFTQAGSWFEGTRNDLARWIGCSKQSVTHNINNLIERGLIERRVRTECGMTFNDYRVTRRKDNAR